MKTLSRGHHLYLDIERAEICFKYVFSLKYAVTFERK